MFVRRSGATVELSLDECRVMYPDQNFELKQFETTRVYTDNITHNVNQMAEKAGIYKELWEPEEIGITTANMLVLPLFAGLLKLTSNAKEFKKLAPENGWGTHEQLIEFVKNYIVACVKWPQAKVEVCR